MQIALNVVHQGHVMDGAPWWQMADDTGIHTIALPDSPALTREIYVASTLAAAATSRTRIMMGVTNPVSRDPSVTAAAVATLNEVAPGRVALGIGTGDSALWGVGAKPAKLATLRSYIVAVQQLLRGETATFDGRSFTMRWADWSPVHIPIVVAVAGPKTLRMAVEVADGMLLSMGFGPDNVSYVNQLIDQSCDEFDRERSDLELWWNTEVVFGTSVEDAMSRGMGVGTNWLTMGSLEGKQIPEHLKQPLLTFNQDIHDLSAEYLDQDRERVLMNRARELGLYEWLISRAPGLWGTPADIAARLRQYDAAGMDRWMFYIGRDEAKRMEQIAAVCQGVLPLV
jgi:5,10-methylenetetrahydromethanopterin reductase